MIRKHLAWLALSALLLAGCAVSKPGGNIGASTVSTSSTAPATPVNGNHVNIDSFAFVPLTLTVPAGTTVTWTNHDEEPHNVVAGDGSFRSPGMATGATYSHTFATAGKFDYVCSIHPMMRGTVVVTS